MAKRPDFTPRKALLRGATFRDPAQLRPFECFKFAIGVHGSVGTVPARKGRPASKGRAYSNFGASVAAVEEGEVNEMDIRGILAQEQHATLVQRNNSVTGTYLNTIFGRTTCPIPATSRIGKRRSLLEGLSYGSTHCEDRL